jgi:hypothetical protein
MNIREEFPPLGFQYRASIVEVHLLLLESMLGAISLEPRQQLPMSAPVKIR